MLEVGFVTSATVALVSCQVWRRFRNGSRSGAASPTPLAEGRLPEVSSGPTHAEWAREIRGWSFPDPTAPGDEVRPGPPTRA